MSANSKDSASGGVGNGGGTESATPPQDNFLSRWSRRKHRARQGGAEAPSTGSDEGTAAAVSKALTDGGAPEPTDAKPALPPVESLDAESDYTGFMSSDVSEELRRAALRKLFHVPAFNVTDGLDDYDEDFRTFEALGDIVTADMRYRMEREEELARERNGEADTQTAGGEVAGDGGEPDVAARGGFATPPPPESTPMTASGEAADTEREAPPPPAESGKERYT